MKFARFGDSAVRVLRPECMLETATKSAVLSEFEKRQKSAVNPEPFLLRKSGHYFFNSSPLDLNTLMGDQAPNQGKPVCRYKGVFFGHARNLRALRSSHYGGSTC